MTTSKFTLSPKSVHESLAKSMIVDGLDVVLDLEKSQGAWLYDSLGKRKVLDFFTFVASAPIGANHPKMWSDKVFLDKLLYAAVMNPSNSDIYSVEMAEFVETFRKIAMPKSMHYTFWIAGGTLGVENAIKAAMDWKVKKNFKKGYKEERGHQVIHFREAFHGRSGYTLSLTNTDPAKTDLYTKFNWPRITNPKVNFPLDERNTIQIQQLEKLAIEEIKEAFRVNKDDIAAIIIEPIQGEGGDNHFRPEFFQALRTLTLENDAMLILDEVQTGIGLTGTMWASDQVFNHPEMYPDMIAFGKKTQVCGFIASTRLDEIDNHVFKVNSRINSTWGGNLVDMLRSKKYLEIIEEEKLIENAKKVGSLLQKQLRDLTEEYKGAVTNARGLGLMCAFDLPSKEIRNKFISQAHKNGLMILGCGQHSVRFRPPLNLTEAELGSGIELVKKSLEHVLALQSVDV